jgi:hypothetical protein
MRRRSAERFRIGVDGSESRAVWPAVIGHQPFIGRDDVAGTQGRIISNGCGDETEDVPAIAGAARDDPRYTNAVASSE